MKRSVFVASVAVATVLLAAVAAPAQAKDSVTVSRFPVSFPFFNPCTNENVDFAGTVVNVIDPSPDDHGLIGHSVDIALEGVGQTTGTRYIEIFTGMTTLQGTEATSDGGAFAETNAVHARLIAPGPANDLVFAIVFHFTINANGEVVGWHNRLTTAACV